ncbi:MAG: CAP domain-containing protein [Anaerolineaceae bacterium]|nr:CAP domain-containing protein [Anaerolineaceae bacterium]
MKKWMYRLSMLLVCCIVWSGLVGFKSETQEPDLASEQTTLSADQLIDLINGARTKNDLPTLIIDNILMSTAQATADEMASRSIINPIGDVCEIALAAGYGNGETAWVRENVARLPLGAGTEAVFDAWADPKNQAPMVDPAYQHIGAGVSVSADGFVYYIIYTAYTNSQNYDPTKPVPARTLVAELIAHAITDVQAADGSENIGQLDFGSTPTVSPLIPGTGRRIDNSIITTLLVVAVIGIAMVIFGLFLKN